MNDYKNIKNELTHPIFSTLSDNEINNLIDNCTVINYKKNEYIIKKDNFITHIYYILEGQAKMNIEYQNKINTIRIIPPNRFIGLSFIFDGDKFEFSSIAIEKCRIMLIDIEVLLQLIKTNGNFAAELVKTISNISLKLVNRLLLYKNKNIEGSMAAFLLHFSNINESDNFSIPFSRKEIAEIIGYSRESVIHTLTKFCKDKLIISNEKKIQIIDKDRLNRIFLKG